MASYQILFWHDIPLQVRVKGSDGRVSVPLGERFQQAIDQAAMAAGLIGSDDYTELLRWSAPQEREGDPHTVAAAVAAEIEARYPNIDWRATATALKSSAEP